jgi:hypothetical protein
MQNLYQAMIGENRCDYYLEKFQQFDLKGTGLNPSWNWSALWFSGLWLLYRKIYLGFFAYCAGISGVVFLVVFSRLDSAIGADIILLLPVVLHLFCALYGNAIYHQSVKKKIAAAELKFKDQDQLIKALHSQGGVSRGSVWAFLLSVIFAIFLIILGIVLVSLVGYTLIFTGIAWFFNTVFCNSGCF